MPGGRLLDQPNGECGAQPPLSRRAAPSCDSNRRSAIAISDADAAFSARSACTREGTLLAGLLGGRGACARWGTSPKKVPDAQPRGGTNGRAWAPAGCAVSLRKSTIRVGSVFCLINAGQTSERFGALSARAASLARFAPAVCPSGRRKEWVRAARGCRRRPPRIRTARSPLALAGSR
jgi:hypothetical protein